MGTAVLVHDQREATLTVVRVSLKSVLTCVFLRCSPDYWCAGASKPSASIARCSTGAWVSAGSRRSSAALERGSTGGRHTLEAWKVLAAVAALLTAETLIWQCFGIEQRLMQQLAADWPLKALEFMPACCRLPCTSRPRSPSVQVHTGHPAATNTAVARRRPQSAYEHGQAAANVRQAVYHRATKGAFTLRFSDYRVCAANPCTYTTANPAAAGPLLACSYVRYLSEQPLAQAPATYNCSSRCSTADSDRARCQSEPVCSACSPAIASVGCDISSCKSCAPSDSACHTTALTIIRRCVCAANSGCKAAATIAGGWSRATPTAGNTYGLCMHAARARM
jgi:hypothetical protein